MDDTRISRDAARILEAVTKPTNVYPIRPSVSGESDAQKWERVKLAKRRVQAALGAEPEMAQEHIREALWHLRGLGVE